MAVIHLRALRLNSDTLKRVLPVFEIQYDIRYPSKYILVRYTVPVPDPFNITELL